MSSLSAGASLGPYELKRLLGRGGMGEVYLAFDPRLAREVALKVLARDRPGADESLDRFRREAITAAALNHPNICTIHEIGDHEGCPFIVMERLEGCTLECRMTERPLDTTEILDVAIQTAQALVAAHALNIVHRDIKPANVFLTRSGLVKVLDFGLAKQISPAPRPDETGLTLAGIVVGTVNYMSPEQALCRQIDHRSDLFSLGTMLYEMAARRRPFERHSVVATLDAIINHPAEPLANIAQVPKDLARAVERLLQKRPEDRYPSARALLDDLRALVSIVHPERGLSTGADSTHRGGLPHTLRTGDLQDLSRGSLATALIAAPASDTLTAGRRTPFIGRDEESRVLLSLADRAIRGCGSLVLLAGEPGVGKSRIVDELRRSAAGRGMLAFTGNCDQMEGTLPYAPFVEIFERVSRQLSPHVLVEVLGRSAPEIARLVPRLRTVLPDLATPMSLPPGQERHFLFNSVFECLERLGRVQPLLLVIEDVHWADEPALLLLRHIAQQLESVPVLIVATCREGEMEGSSPLSTALEDLIRRRKVNRIFLKALSREAVRSLLEALGGRQVPDPVTDAIHGTTEGNPFFVEEVFDHLAERAILFDAVTGWSPSFRFEALDVPHGVRLVIGRRLQALSAAGIRTLHAAAVIGRSFTFDMLRAVAEVGANDLLDITDEIERAHLVTSARRGREVVFSFKHALIRETLLQAISLPRRQQLHLRVAGALEASTGDTEDRVPDLAHHLYEAGSFAEPGRAARYLKLAGDMSLDAAGFEEALRLYDRAEALQAAEGEKLADLLYRRGLALRGLSRWDELVDVWRRALALLEVAGDNKAGARVCHDLALLLIWAAHYQQAHELCGRGLELLGDEVSPLRCRLLARGAIGQAGDGNYAGSSTLISQALAIAHQLDDPELRAQVLSHKAICHFGFMETRAQLEAGLASLELLGPSGNPWERCEAMWNAQSALLYAGRLDEVHRMGGELAQLATRVGHFGARWAAERCAGMRNVLITADFAAFEQFARRDLEVIQTAAKPLVSHSYAWLGLAQFWAGKWREAGENFETAFRVEVPVFTAGVAWSLLFVWKCYVGDREGALAMYREKRRAEFSTGTQRPTGKWSVLFGMIEGLAVLGEREEAAPLYPFVRDAVYTGTVLRFQAAGQVETIAGIGAACAALWDRAEEHYANALHQAETIPNKVEQAEVRRWLARMLLERNGPDDSRRARLLAADAAERYRTMGMTGHLKLAEEMVEM